MGGPTPGERSPGLASCVIAAVELDPAEGLDDVLGDGAWSRAQQVITARLAALLGDGHEIEPAELGFIVRTRVDGEADLEAEATALATRLHAAVTQPLEIEGQPVLLTACIGTATDEDGDGCRALRRARTAARVAARRGAATTTRHQTDQRTRDAALDDMGLEAALHGALANDEMRLVFQPQCSLLTGEVVGVEALLRWSHPHWGKLGPARFIIGAERTGLIVPIGAWVLREAATVARRWEQRYPTARDMSLHVNVSARQFADASLVEDVASIIEEVGVDPAMLCLEITETALMHDLHQAVRMLGELRALGVRVAMDDFGVGQSSLGHLRQLPIDELKIDKVFVSRLGSDPIDGAIVAAVVNIARVLGMRVVAEGVETERQRRELRALGCAHAQGYLFARPLELDDMERVLETSAPLGLAS